MSSAYELARMFRRRYHDAPLRLVAVTAYDTPRDRALSRASGFDAHVQKPVDVAMVEAMLAPLLDPATSSFASRAAPAGERT